MNKSNESFWLKSYNSHYEHDKNPNFEKVATWKNFNTVDAWRHKRMYDNTLPLINNYKSSKWLTIGDGRYGTDANYLIRNDITDVLATSISDVLLKKSKEDGFINNYKVENAESLSFEDGSFDFVFCKEAYHHFPRPTIALYEMLRVAKIGVIIIEPNDPNMVIIDKSKILIKNKNRWQIIKDSIKDIIGIKRYQFTNYSDPVYEVSGNYLYSTSRREFEKVALGLNYPFVAFKGMNDYYFDGVEYEIANESSELFGKIKNGINNQDIACSKGESNYGLLVSLIFKEIPNEKAIKELLEIGFDVKKLSRNPYS